MRRGCASLQDLQNVILAEKKALLGPDDLTESMYPRWVRVNNVRSTLDKQMETTFTGYDRVNNLSDLKSAKQIYTDAHIPDLVALPPGVVDFSSSTAYKNGEIILQDKASCFPAYLLLGDVESSWDGGDLVDGCAAPGNKTTHLASILAAQQKLHSEKKLKKSKIIAMDASAARSKTLQKMVSVAGANKLVTVLAGQDFLALNPDDEQFESVTGLLLDPSCSGSGIIGRDDVPKLILPEQNKVSKTANRGTKRKRPVETVTITPDEKPNETLNTDGVDTERLLKLSNLQTHIVEHALRFPAATKVTYSTCSTHMLENECVVRRVLSSDVARRRGWRIMRRAEQPKGLQKWKHRGIRAETGSKNEDRKGTAITVDLTDEQIDACLRCWPGDEECTGGFFVAGFVRDESLAEELPVAAETNGAKVHNTTKDSESESEWEGFE